MRSTNKIRICIGFCIRMHELTLQKNWFWRLPWSFKKVSWALNYVPTSACRADGQCGMDVWSQTLCPGSKVAHLNSDESRGSLARLWARLRVQNDVPARSLSIWAGGQPWGHTPSKKGPPRFMTPRDSLMVPGDSSYNPRWLCAAPTGCRLQRDSPQQSMQLKSPFFAQKTKAQGKKRVK